MQPVDNLNPTRPIESIDIIKPQSHKIANSPKTTYLSNTKLSEEEREHISNGIFNKTFGFYLLMPAAGIATIVKFAAASAIASSVGGWLALGSLVAALLLLAARHQAMKKLDLETDTTKHLGLGIIAGVGSAITPIVMGISFLAISAADENDRLNDESGGMRRNS